MGKHPMNYLRPTNPQMELQETRRIYIYDSMQQETAEKWFISNQTISSWKVSTDLTKHRQFFGKVHHSGYGRGDNFCKLTEGFYIHFVSFRCIDHGRLTNFLRLKRQRQKVTAWAFCKDLTRWIKHVPTARNGIGLNTSYETSEFKA